MDKLRNKAWILPALGIFAAIATNAIANAGDRPGVGALLLLPLLGIFWY